MSVMCHSLTRTNTALNRALRESSEGSEVSRILQETPKSLQCEYHEVRKDRGLDRYLGNHLRRNIGMSDLPESEMRPDSASAQTRSLANKMACFMPQWTKSSSSGGILNTKLTQPRVNFRSARMYINWRGTLQRLCKSCLFFVFMLIVITRGMQDGEGDDSGYEENTVGEQQIYEKRPDPLVLESKDRAIVQDAHTIRLNDCRLAGSADRSDRDLEDPEGQLRLWEDEYETKGLCQWVYELTCMTTCCGCCSLVQPSPEQPKCHEAVKRMMRDLGISACYDKCTGVRCTESCKCPKMTCNGSFCQELCSAIGEKVKSGAKTVIQLPKIITETVKSFNMKELSSGHLGAINLACLIIGNHLRMWLDGGLIESTLKIGEWEFPLLASVSRSLMKANGYSQFGILVTNIFMFDYILRELNPSMDNVAALIRRANEDNPRPGCFSFLCCMKERLFPNMLSKLYVPAWMLLGVGMQLIGYFPTATPWDALHGKCAAVMFAGVFGQFVLSGNIAYKLSNIDVEKLWAMESVQLNLKRTYKYIVHNSISWKKDQDVTKCGLNDEQLKELAEWHSNPETPEVIFTVQQETEFAEFKQRQKILIGKMIPKAKEMYTIAIKGVFAAIVTMACFPGGERKNVMTDSHICPDYFNRVNDPEWDPNDPNSPWQSPLDELPSGWDISDFCKEYMKFDEQLRIRGEEPGNYKFSTTASDLEIGGDMSFLVFWWNFVRAFFGFSEHSLIFFQVILLFSLIPLMRLMKQIV